MIQIRLRDGEEERAEQIRLLSDSLFVVAPVPGHPDRVEVWFG